MRLLSTIEKLTFRLGYSRKDNLAKVVLLSVLFSSQCVFGQNQTATPQKVKTTETGVEIYEGVGVEGIVSKTLDSKSSTEVKSKSIQEFTIEECVNSITDIDNKIRIIQSQQGSQAEIAQYLLYKDQLIQRKQTLISQQTTK